MNLIFIFIFELGASVLFLSISTIIKPGQKRLGSQTSPKKERETTPLKQKVVALLSCFSVGAESYSLSWPGGWCGGVVSIKQSQHDLHIQREVILSKFISRGRVSGHLLRIVFFHISYCNSAYIFRIVCLT